MSKQVKIDLSDIQDLQELETENAALVRLSEAIQKGKEDITHSLMISERRLAALEQAAGVIKQSIDRRLTSDGRRLPIPSFSNLTKPGVFVYIEYDALDALAAALRPAGEKGDV